MGNAATIRELLEAYDRLRGIDEAYWRAHGYKNAETAGMSLPELSTVAVKYKSMSNPPDDWANQWPGAWPRGWQGWVRHQSGLRWCIHGEQRYRPDEHQLGPPLWGEWCRDNRGVHFKADPAKCGEFQYWCYRERPLDTGDNLVNGEIAVLSQRITVLAQPQDDTIGEDNRIVYHLYWGAPVSDPAAIRRLCYRFAGFQACKQKGDATATQAKEETHP